MINWPESSVHASWSQPIIQISLCRSNYTFIFFTTDGNHIPHWDYLKALNIIILFTWYDGTEYLTIIDSFVTRKSVRVGQINFFHMHNDFVWNG